MEFLTASEMAKIWNISSRMVAYYCKAGKIAGAMKKGKTWLIPAHTEKPVDNRFSINKQDDILSSLVRAVTFDQNGYKGTKMCLVRRATKKEQAAGKTYLESGRCLHTVLQADSHDDTIMEKMFFAAFGWAE